MTVELFTSAACPHCADAREELEWRGEAFVEYDIDADAAARERFFALSREHPIVPLLVRDGAVQRAGRNGLGCYISPP